jgi:hypothetical protein
VTTAPEEDYWKTTTLFAYIGKSGEFVIPAQYNWARSFSDGVAPVCTGPCRNQDLPDARVGYIDRRGKYVIAPQYRSGTRFSEGRAWVSGTSGVLAPEQLIDVSGKIVSARLPWQKNFRTASQLHIEGSSIRKGKPCSPGESRSMNEAFLTDGLR